MPANSALKSFMKAEGAIQAIMVTAQEVTAFPFMTSSVSAGELVGRLQFQIKCAMVRRPDQDRIADRLLADVQRELEALHDAILAPMNDRLADVDRLLVVPYSVLHAFPFLALWRDGRYLMERLLIARVPSARVLRHPAWLPHPSIQRWRASSAWRLPTRPSRAPAHLRSVPCCPARSSSLARLRP